MSPIEDLLNAVAAEGRVPGGCDDCDAYQQMHQAAPGVWVLGVFHDDDRHEQARREAQ